MFSSGNDEEIDIDIDQFIRFIIKKLKVEQ